MPGPPVALADVKLESDRSLRACGSLMIGATPHSKLKSML